MGCIPENFLCLLIRGTDLTEDERNLVKQVYENLGRGKLLRLVQKKKLLPFAANAFVFCDLDTAYWKQILEQYRTRNKVILKCLDKAYAELARQGVKKMFVSENFGALLSADNDLALFTSGDVDNHADPAEKEKIYRAFENLGYIRKERFSGKLQIAAEFFPPETEGLPEKFYISVVFYPLARLKLPCFIRSNEFVDWDAIFCYKATSIKLPPAEALMYICMQHTSLHSFSRAPDIRLYVDLLNMCQTKVDYELLAVWCRRDRTCTRASTAAQLANILLGTKMPETIIRLSEKRHKVISLVYDDNKHDLRYEPRGFKVLRIEANCHDRGVLFGLREILFPDREWMKKVYGNSGLFAHLKHFCKVM